MGQVEKIGSSILSILHKLNGKYGKLYCYPSQRKILELLEEFYGIKISIATLNRWLRKMEDAGLIVRQHRHRWSSVMGWEFRSTLYMIAVKGYHFLARLGVPVWKQIRALTRKALEAGEGVVKKARGPKKLSSILEGIRLLGGSKRTALIK